MEISIFTGSIAIDLIIGLVTILFLIYYWLASINNFWSDLGIPYVKPVILFGNNKDSILGNRTMIDIQSEIYSKLEGKKFGGFYLMLSPVLMIKDPDLIENVLVKDFSHFVDRSESFVDVDREPLSAGLSLLTGNQWRHMRYKLTPTFTSGKLKRMFEQIYNCGEELLENLKKKAVKREAVEAKKVLSIFSADVIASCAFGLQFQHGSDESITFRKMAEDIFSPNRLQIIKFLLATYSVRLGKMFGALNFPKETSQYFLNLTKKTIDYRNKNKIDRNDFLQLLLRLREQEKNGKFVSINHNLNEEDAYLRQSELENLSDGNLELTDGVLAAQAFLFLTAGSETISWAVSFTLFSLATHPQIQSRVQKEVENVLAKHGGWTYQAVKDMTYLDQVVQESLRIHPFILSLNRVVTKPYKIPGTELVLEKGVRINIPVYALHMDPQIYPNPETFDPDRSRDNNHKSSWKYLPFGDGPRMCIGMRFAILEVKMCLARVLSTFSVTLSDKTENPLQYDFTFFPRPKGGIWLYFHDRSRPLSL